MDEKSQKAEAKHNQMLEDARQATDAFYKKHAETKEKKRAANR